MCGKEGEIGEEIEYLFGVVEQWIEQWYVVYLGCGEIIVVQLVYQICLFGQYLYVVLVDVQWQEDVEGEGVFVEYVLVVGVVDECRGGGVGQGCWYCGDIG